MSKANQNKLIFTFFSISFKNKDSYITTTVKCMFCPYSLVLVKGLGKCRCMRRGASVSCVSPPALVARGGCNAQWMRQSLRARQRRFPCELCWLPGLFLPQLCSSKLLTHVLAPSLTTMNTL